MNREKLPKHIAIIMDGNGRWAKLHRLPRLMGHKKGVETIRKIVEASSDMGIEALTLFAFSTENWNRPKKEIEGLMRLLRDYIDRESDKLIENNIQFRAIGRIDGLPQHIQSRLKGLTDKSNKNTGMILNIALNYGGRAEIVDAARKVAQDAKKNRLQPDEIDEKLFASYLYTNKLPDPDLLIRTSGEMRVSNFLLWQISYAEIYATPKLWPDFTQNDLQEAIRDYANRERRFGKSR